jgi:hypothetical protein
VLKHGIQAGAILLPRVHFVQGVGDKAVIVSLKEGSEGTPIEFASSQSQAPSSSLCGTEQIVWYRDSSFHEQSITPVIPHVNARILG